MKKIKTVTFKSRGEITKDMQRSIDRCVREKAIEDRNNKDAYRRGAARPYKVMVVVNEWWDCVATCHHKSHADEIADFYLSKGFKARVDGHVERTVLGEAREPKDYKNS